ncbi:MAG: sugar phosphate isomerase/epimerase [Planctomycetaceae bacterium]|nr:sugar phosphate isomerase/epimerase [Planctomycetaceae bacterium]
MNTNRRQFLQVGASAFAGMSLVSAPSFSWANAAKPKIHVSLAQWSLHRTLRAGKLDNLDFAKVTKREFGIEGVEYVNSFFKDKAKDTKYLTEMKKRAHDEGVTNVLIMVDGEGALGDADKKKRRVAVENHFQWVDAAKFLGCHSIRVNASSTGSYQEQIELAADGLRQVSEYGGQHNINVIVENHGGLSSNGQWLSSVIKKVDHPSCGTLPDFGNFAIDRNKGEWYDRYKGVKELMPFAKAVSVKTSDFDDARPYVTVDTRYGKETDIMKMMKIVLAAGYTGYAGIEYEGSKLGEYEGIKRSKVMLDAVLAKLL